MKSFRTFLSGCLCTLLACASSLAAADRTSLPRLTSAPGAALTEPEREAMVAWVRAQPEIRAHLAGRRTRLLQVGSNLAKADGAVHRTITFIWRDYAAGVARQATADLETGAITLRDVRGVQPSAEEIAEGMTIVRRDRALNALTSDPTLELIGGFHNLAPHRDDPCAREVCLDFAFMRPNYEGPARYVIVNLTRGIVAHHDFRPRPGEGQPRMTEPADR